MLSAEQNDRITRVGPSKPAGGLLRRYWQPAALVDELGGNRPIKPVRLLGEDLVIFRDETGRYGLLGRACPAAPIWRMDVSRTAVCVAHFMAGCSMLRANACRRRRSRRTAICVATSVTKPIPS